jgi:large subunit ribosomal protein L21
LVELLVSLRRTEIYAIVETGGKQYRVAPKQVLEIDSLDVVEGDTVELDRVLLISDGEKLTVGTPVIEGAKVMATSGGNGKGKKVLVFRYKNKIRYRRKTGHRQAYTRLIIDKIVGPEGEEKPARKARRKREVSTDGA